MPRKNQSISSDDEKLELRFIKLSDLTLFAHNAKLHDIGAISQSIQRYGFLDPLKWDKNLNQGKGGIVEGNGRLETLMQMFKQKQLAPRGIAADTDGEWCVPVLFGLDAESEAQAAAYSIDHNNLTLAGGDGFTALDVSQLYDPEAYKSLLQELADIEMMPISVDLDDLNLMLEISEPEPEPEEDEEATAELVEKADRGEIESRVSSGQIWACGRHYICCGDSTDEQQVRRLLGARKVDMVWADPPYGINIVATNVTAGGGEAYDIPFGGVKDRKGYVRGGNCNRTPIAVCQERKRKKQGLGSIGGAKPFGSKDVRGSIGASNVVKVNKYFPIAGDDSIETAITSVELCIELFPDAIQIWWGGNYYAHVLPPSSCWIVWDKENTGNFADAELAWTNHKSAVRIFRHMWNGMLKDSERGERRVHPTQKPVTLTEWAFDKYGSANDVIFDPFLGSGISVIAAQKMEGDRTVYGMELSPEYCEVSLQRWEKLTGKTAQLISSVN